MKRRPVFAFTCFFILPLVILLFSSCQTARESIDARINNSNHTYGGDSYSQRSRDKAALGFHLSMHWLVALVQNESDELNSFESFESGRDYNENLFVKKESEGKFYLLTGIGLAMKNASDGGDKIHTFYLQVPIDGIYAYTLSDGSKVFGGLGPYLAYGIGGKMTGSGFSTKSFDKDQGYKRFDAGLNFTAGYIFPKGFSASVSYDLGLLDIDRINDDYTRNRSFSLGVGVPLSLFTKKK